MPLTLLDKVNSKLGRSATRVAWDINKRDVRSECRGINLGLLNQGLGPAIDVLSNQITVAVRATAAGTATGDNGAAGILRQRAVVLAIVTNYQAICNAEMLNPNNTATIQGGWRTMVDNVLRIKARIEAIHGNY